MKRGYTCLIQKLSANRKFGCFPERLHHLSSKVHEVLGRKWWRLSSVRKDMWLPFLLRIDALSMLIGMLTNASLPFWKTRGNGAPKTGTRSLLWHHDNASPHKAAATVAALTENKVKILPHPPYSPDLAPCDFFLFPFVKERLRGIHFESPEAAVHAYEREISTMEPEIWHNCFNSWFSRMKLCIQAGGEYFEKL